MMQVDNSASWWSWPFVYAATQVWPMPRLGRANLLSEVTLYSAEGKNEEVTPDGRNEYAIKSHVMLQVVVIWSHSMMRHLGACYGMAKIPS
jgi:hypothetical protein